MKPCTEGTMTSDRRTFITTAAAVTAAAGAQTAHSQPSGKSDLIRVGVMALGDNSHMNYDIWAPMFNLANGEIHPKWPIGRTTNMIITHCWDREYERAEAFAKKFGCTAVKNYDDMVGKVDGLVCAGFNECKWWVKLVRPYLEAGTPCFINRPFAYSMKDAKEIVRLSKENNAPILCTDEREYIQQAVVARNKVEQFLRDGRTFLGADSTNASGEWSQHGVHGLYFLLAVFGTNVKKVSYVADGWWKEKTPTATLQHYGQLNLLYDGLSMDGAGSSERPFIVSQHQCWPKADISLRISHDMGLWDIQHEATTGDNTFPRHFYLFFPTVLAMQRMFETREMQWSHEYILDKTRIFLTAFKSHLEHDGAMLDVASLPDDWEAPSPYADWIDESIFG
jgi:predicted dehydrogenase